MSVLKKSVTDLINDEYRTYSMYVIENRAIPSAIDGLKPVQRKLLYSMIKSGGANRKIKIAELGGGLSSVGYHHGESSAQGAAVNMAQDWSNNAPLFTGHGNFGSRLVPESAAPRYIFATLSDNYSKYFTDEEICPRNSDEEHPEPAHYLPIIPWVLVNGIKGIAVGFATEILPRSPKDLAAACKAVLRGQKIKSITPTFPNFKGKVEQVSDNQWKTVGSVSIDKLICTITELPIGVDREGYVNFLNKLIDEDKILDFDDLCSENGFKFEVKINRQQKSKIEANPVGYFKLEKTFSENITTLGSDGKLKLFENEYDLIKYFVEYRTQMFQKRIDYKLNEILAKISFLQKKREFIRHVVEGKIDFKVMKKIDLINYIQTHITEEDFGKRFISIPLYECTEDLVHELSEQIKKLNNEDYQYWQTTTAVKEFEKSLNNV